MSTVTKINPSVRQARYARARVVRMAQGAADSLFKANRGSDAIKTLALADSLDAVRRASNMTGRQKDDLFRRGAHLMMQAVA